MEGGENLKGVTMIHLRQIYLQRGTKVLLEGASLDLFAGQKVGIVGPNGAGKSSLFQCLLGNLQPDKGEIDIPTQCSIAHLKQELPESTLSAIDYALLGNPVYADLKVELDAADASGDGMRIGEAHAKFAEIDGYSAPSRAAIILLGLGFAQAQLHQPVNSFSGGWRMRLNLAQVLLSDADMMLLDEPTNHLDLEGVMWLADWLKQLECMVLVISHDREFLDDVASHIVQFKNANLKRYTGNYTDFEREYAEQLAVQAATHKKQQAQRAHLQKFIDRFGAKATKAKQAQSRVKQLERMKLVGPVHQDSPFEFAFFDNVCGVDPMLSLDDVDVGYDKPILHKLNMSVRDGDRIGLLGLNGAGKSTFIKLIAQQLQPVQGNIRSSSKIKVGYFAQHQLDLLEESNDALSHLRKVDPRIMESEARKFLGGFNFRDDRVFEPVGNFSGGEKSRLVLALLVRQKPNLLLLDEPTNHLDLEMREALMQALQSFQGAMILVAHDRYLLKCLVDEYWLVHDGGVNRFEGDLDDYHNWLLSREEPVAAEREHVKAKATSAQTDKKLAHLERKLDKVQAQLTEVEQALCENDLYTEENSAKLQKLQAKQQNLAAEVSDYEDQILALLDE